MKRFLGLGWAVVLCLVFGSAAAQETGAIFGTVTDEQGQVLPGVTVTASTDVLPQPRVAVTGAGGRYDLPALPPGDYELRFGLEGFGEQTRQIRVLLQQRLLVDVRMGLSAIEETIEVIGEGLIDPTSAEIKTSIGEDVVEAVPTGQEYRDLVKLIPGVQYTEESVRGPSAGGSGQDNVYKIDGVNVSLPLFGTLSAEPSSHDVAQVAVVKGGADASDFNRSGGFTINSISKSGTNAFQGEVSYQIQTEGMTGDRESGDNQEFDQDRDWTVASIGGPILGDQLFFYTSYYRPTVERDSRANVYGDVPDFESDRDELFGKLTWAPTQNLLVHGSYRGSEREEFGASIAADAAATTSEGADADQEITILEGTWVVGANSFASFEYTDYGLETAGRPDLLFDFPIRLDGSVRLDVANLDRQGLLEVPIPLAGEDAYNAFVQPLIDRFGFLQNGARVGGGQVGAGSTINDQDFFRESIGASYDHHLDGRVSHELHFGYQWYEDEEVLSRLSNGWGAITVVGGLDDFENVPDFDVPVFYRARFEQMSIIGAEGAVIEPIRSGFESQNIELQDTIRLANWTFNVGVLLSNDELYGQGLRENSANVSGFELSPGSRYKMYELDFEDQIQPRLGAVWAYNGADTVFANYARYNPAASSLPRAASWARNLRASIDAFFDVDGNLLGSQSVAASSGKFFQDDLDARSIDEYLLGTARQINRQWTARAHVRHRYGSNFWEDTNNNARLVFDPPPGVPQDLYIPELDSYRAEVGGSSYVIAELDDAFTKYWEASVDADWRGERTFFRGSYVWSHYYGNFDQDNTAAENDDNIFIGSSNLADGRGRQIWDNRYGDLRGDRRHQLKLYGYYRLPWEATVGAFAIYQSGQPWEAWDATVFGLAPTASETARFGEAAGSRRTDAHYQLDLNYSHPFRFGSGYEVQLRADVFNVFDKQTGYNIQNRVHTTTPVAFGLPRDFYDPRRLQLGVAFRF
jgi:hypothetical protein